MSSSTLLPFSTPSPTPPIDPPNPGQFDAGDSRIPSKGRDLFVAGAGGGVAATLVLLTACALWRARFVRRRRAALGLPPVAMRGPREEYQNILKHMPVIYDAWTDLGVDLENQMKRWDQMQALSSTRVFSLPIPQNHEERHDPFKNYFTSILELVSVKRMDKALLEALPKDRPPPEYAKSELVASVMISMPRPRGDSTTESWHLPELEFGIYEGPWPKESL